MPTKRIGKARLLDNVEPQDLLMAHLNAKRPQTELEECEWNFAACPKTHLPYCKIYEFARSSPKQIAEVSEWQSSDFAGFDAPIERTTNFDRYWRQNFFRLFPEFPDIPWLRLIKSTRAEVDRRIQQIRKIQPIRFRTVPSDSLLHDETLHEQMETFGFGLHGTIQAIEVNWLASEKQLIDAFKQWMRDYRPVREHEERGRTSPAEWLKALSAKRLLDHYSAQDAITVSADVLNEPLFQSQSKWLDAAAKARAELEGPVPPLAQLLRKTKGITGFSEDEINTLIHWWLTVATAADQRTFLRLAKSKVRDAVRRIVLDHKLP